MGSPENTEPKAERFAFWERLANGTLLVPEAVPGPQEDQEARTYPRAVGSGGQRLIMRRAGGRIVGRLRGFMASGRPRPIPLDRGPEWREQRVGLHGGSIGSSPLILEL
jgi:hypothetical protein